VTRAVGRLTSDRQLWPRLILWILIAAFACTFSWLSVARHLAYQSHAFDLGNMSQAVWNTAHGNLFRFTDMAVGSTVLTSRLAIHVEPLLVPLSLLYWVHSGASILLVVQAVVVALGAWPLYALAASLLQRPWLSLVFPFAYLAHPSLQNAVLDDFHPVTLSACLLAWAMYCIWSGRLSWYAVAAILAASTKEEISLLIAMLGLPLLLRGHRIAGIVSIVAGMGWFLICVVVIIPHYNPAGHSPYLSRYAYLGHGLSDILRHLLFHPGTAVHALLSDGRRPYLLYVVHPVGLVSLLGGPVLLLALPGVAINLLSADASMYSGFYQYSAEVVPYAVVAAVVGAYWTLRALRRMRTSRHRLVLPVVCALVLLGSITDCWKWGFTPLSSGYVAPSAGAHQALETQIVREIPPDATVAAADEIEPHVSDRRWAYLLPTIRPSNGPRARYIVLDASIPASPFGPRALHAVALNALQHGYRVRRAEDGILLLQRGDGRGLGPAPNFLDFAFGLPGTIAPLPVRWGNLELLGYVAHPRGGVLDRARPAVSVETYWRITGRISKSAHLSLLASPAYATTPPPVGRNWLRTGDSPTLAWLPLRTWHTGAVYHVAFVPLVPSSLKLGRVEVALRVTGLGPAYVRSGGHAVRGADDTVRLVTVSVTP
jgi:uncharacterized membrane protein